MQVIEAAQLRLADWIRPGDRVMWGQACAEPRTLTQLLREQRHLIARGERFGVFLGIGAGTAIDPGCTDSIDMIGYCGTGTTRALAQAGCLDILPAHYSQMATLLAEGRIRIDVLLLQVTPGSVPDRWRLTLAQEYLTCALERARVVIAQCNDQAPAMAGAAELTSSRIDVLVHASEPPLEMPSASPSAVEERIAAHVASLIDDGATLQFGLGSVPDAVLAGLRDRRDLGIHSGLLSDRAADLMEAGVVTGARKTRDRHLTVAGVLMGTRRLFAHIHQNADVRLVDTRYSHDIEVLSSLDHFVAINSAVEVDATGQVNAEIAGGIHVGAVGGSADFLRGAARSRGGRPIIALPSTAGRRSRIVRELEGPVTTARSDIAFVVTEYGVADLRGATLRQRRQRLIDIAHPDFRAMLDDAALPPNPLVAMKGPAYPAAAGNDKGQVQR
ncbi:MAG TPA: acetyl-CoA hydrolase/transferase C-terminal domain-containing protein [Ramlibacter sp.]|nr:acetyl-CoA hydrolase/transferase C-terminal domain-containing protein [Ramlibacter sp.]